MPPNRFESEVESFLEGSHGDRTHIKRADHHTVTPLCGTLLHKCSSCGGCRRDRKARLRRPWAMAGPGWAIHSDPFPLVWRAPEGPEGLAAAAVGGGGAWPGFETTRRAKLAARTASGRATAHGRTKQPGPTSQALRRPKHPWDHKQQQQEGRRPRAHKAAQHGTQREAARPHRDQAAHASGDSYQKPRISQRSRWRRRGHPRR